MRAETQGEDTMKTSLRTCVGCRRATPAGELLRLVLLADGSLALGNRGGRAGRGASIHRKDACVKKAIATRSFARAFRGRPLRLGDSELTTALLKDLNSAPTSFSSPGDESNP